MCVFVRIQLVRRSGGHEVLRRANTEGSNLPLGMVVAPCFSVCHVEAVVLRWDDPPSRVLATSE